MKLKVLGLMILLLLGQMLYAQFDEKSILTQQGYQLMSRRQYSEAEQIFKQVLAKYPADTNSVLQLIQIHFATSQPEKAEAVLQEFGRILPQTLYTEQMIQVHIMQGKLQPAWDLSLSYIAQNPSDQNRYRTLAAYFERRGFYEQGLELYQMARKNFGNESLFSLEIANSALNYRQLELSLREYLRYLDQNPANLYFVSNQCKTIIKEDSTLVSVLGAFSSGAVNPVIYELYANVLLELKQFDRALEIYKSLSWDKLHRFAEEQFVALNDSVAYAAFAHLRTSVSDDIQKAEYRYKMAQISMRNLRWAETKQNIQSIINDPVLSNRNFRARSALGLLSRKLMAELVLAQSAAIDSALFWFKEAQAFARNQIEQSEIELELSRLMIISKQYTLAEDKLKSIRDIRQAEQGKYYSYLIALMQKNLAVADSLMNEYIIAYPGSRFTNDMIYLMMLAYSLEGEDLDLFLDAYRQRQLYQRDAVDMLMTIFAHNADEELRLLAIEWALQLADKQEALRLLEYEWQDSIAKEYAALLKLKLSTDSETEQRYAREFLRNNPNSIFSPNFRQSINRIGTNKPNL